MKLRSSLYLTSPILWKGKLCLRQRKFCCWHWSTCRLIVSLILWCLVQVSIHCVYQSPLNCNSFLYMYIYVSASFWGRYIVFAFCLCVHASSHHKSTLNFYFWGKFMKTCMLAYFHVKISILLRQFDRTFLRRVWRYQRDNQSESVNRRTDNTMAKRKRTKEQTKITKPRHKTKDWATRTSLKAGNELGCSGVFALLDLQYFIRHVWKRCLFKVWRVFEGKNLTE